MKFVKNWSIRNKIRVPLVLVGIFLLWMSWSSYQATASVGKQVHDFDVEFLPSISLVLNADRDLYQSLVALREIMDRRQSLSATRFEALNQERLENHQQTLDRGLEAIERMGANIAPGHAEDFVQKMDAWLQHSNALVAGQVQVENMALFEAPRTLLDNLGARVDELAGES